MKRLFLIVSLSLLLISCSTIQPVNNGEVILVKPEYAEIPQMVHVVYNELETIINQGNSVFIIKVNGEKQQNFDVSIYKKSDFGWSLRRSEEIPYGYFLHNDIPVIIFGNPSDKLFSKTSKKQYFEWLKPLPPLKDDEVIISPIVDTPFWKYEFSNDKFVFKEVSW